MTKRAVVLGGLLASACLPYVSPPVRVSAGGGLAVAAGGTRSGAEPAREDVLVRVGVHPQQMFKAGFDRRLDVGVGYLYESLYSPRAAYSGGYVTAAWVLDVERYDRRRQRRLTVAATGDVLVDELASGACCGPGMALAWSLQYFMLSFTTDQRLRVLLKGLSRVLFFPLKYVDHFLIEKPGALDAASAYYFLGRKCERLLSDREVLDLYRGAA